MVMQLPRHCCQHDAASYIPLRELENKLRNPISLEHWIDWACFVYNKIYNFYPPSISERLWQKKAWNLVKETTPKELKIYVERKDTTLGGGW